MSLAKRLDEVTPQSSCRRCGTCMWVESLTAEDQAAFHSWIAQDRSLTQLWHVAVKDVDNPYALSLESLRTCVRVHQRVHQR